VFLSFAFYLVRPFRLSPIIIGDDLIGLISFGVKTKASSLQSSDSGISSLTRGFDMTDNNGPNQPQFQLQPRLNIDLTLALLAPAKHDRTVTETFLQYF